jgi:hypothetical protein
LELRRLGWVRNGRDSLKNFLKKSNTRYFLKRYTRYWLYNIFKKTHTMFKKSHAIKKNSHIIKKISHIMLKNLTHYIKKTHSLTVISKQ